MKEDYVLKPTDPHDRYAEFDSQKTVNEIIEAIEDNGHSVVPLGNARKLLEMAKRPEVDIVFNIAEGDAGRNRESQVPIILELLEIPYIGADALTLGLSLDKIFAKEIFIYHGIPTPKFFQAEKLEDLKKLKLKFPLIVKPRFEGSSKGLNEDALVYDSSALKKRVQWLLETYKQPALIEEFISGEEFTVAVIGNDPAKVYRPVQIAISGKLDLGDLFYTHENVTSTDLDYVYPAPISKELAARIQELSLTAYRAVECRDWGRVDIRTNKKGEVFILEINPLPSLCSDDVFPLIAKYEGMTFSSLVGSILNAGLKRYNMFGREEKNNLTTKNFSAVYR
ncbi:MAG: hypothetical protein AB1629_03285 [Candidatus Omnitrophota bacterium]